MLLFFAYAYSNRSWRTAISAEVTTFRRSARRRSAAAAPTIPMLNSYSGRAVGTGSRHRAPLDGHKITEGEWARPDLDLIKQAEQGRAGSARAVCQGTVKYARHPVTGRMPGHYKSAARRSERSPTTRFSTRSTAISPRPMSRSARRATGPFCPSADEAEPRPSDGSPQ
jgi:hypothetical protein